MTTTQHNVPNNEMKQRTTNNFRRGVPDAELFADIMVFRPVCPRLSKQHVDTTDADVGFNVADIAVTRHWIASEFDPALGTMSVQMQPAFIDAVGGVTDNIFVLKDAQLEHLTCWSAAGIHVCITRKGFYDF